MFRCYNIEILSDINFEGNKSFTVDITPQPELNRIHISPAAMVTIIDYNGEWTRVNGGQYLWSRQECWRVVQKL